MGESRVRYDSLDLAVDNVFTVFADCACGNPNGCVSCCGTGVIPEVADLTTLLHNIAVAGALTLSWVHGWNAALQDDDAWSPNIDGVAAP